MIVMLLILALVSGTGASNLHAESLDKIHQINQVRTDSAKASQARVDQLDAQRNKLLAQYRETTSIIDGLRIYNQQLEKQIKAQQVKLQELDESARQATGLKRQVTPVMVKMLAALEQFVLLDIPFHQKERNDRLRFIGDALVNPDITDSEKFRQVLEGYQIENEYGRKIDTYTDAIRIGDSDVNVNILRVGRIALIAQTKDERITLAWDNQKRQWVELPSSYRNPVRQGIRIARKQATRDMMFLPIPAPVSMLDPTEKAITP